MAARASIAADEQTLLKMNQTKPKHVPGTPYWVITNITPAKPEMQHDRAHHAVNAIPAELIGTINPCIRTGQWQSRNHAAEQPAQQVI